MEPSTLQHTVDFYIEQIEKVAREKVQHVLSFSVMRDQESLYHFSTLCKHSFALSPDEEIFQEISLKALDVLQAPAWSDFISCNLPCILDALYITHCALEPSAKRSNDLKRILYTLTDLLQGDYLLRTEWSPNYAYELKKMMTILELPLAEATLKLLDDSLEYDGERDLWRWTAENARFYRDSRISDLLFTRKEKLSLDQMKKEQSISLRLLCAAISAREHTKIGELLYILSLQGTEETVVMRVAWELLLPEHVTYSNALPFLCAIKHFKKMEKENGT
ncbi:hypothetical protein [Caldalkalibacillus mannanilyticus]|uniref:hypothetical protein n=1 Tax=Caldalkalibacillus mannanilyticus TaxID=1418 RepID=UPI0004692F84|nr:hypothetical protein [Caldalkalibacillus mannanilyticus]